MVEVLVPAVIRLIKEGYMICDLCGKKVYFYTGRLLYPWYGCRECGAVYCDRCSKGEMPDSPACASPEQLYQISKQKSCIRCSGSLYKKKFYST